MNNKDIAARLLVLEQRVQELASDIRNLFQDVLDAEQNDGVE